MKKIAGGLLAAILLTGPVAAQTSIDGSDVGEIVNIARGFGSATLEQPEGGPLLRGRIDGDPYVIVFQNCDSSTSCDDFIFRAYFINPVVDQELANAWNRDKRWTKVYFDHEDDVVMEMDVDMTGGISLTNLEQAFSYWSFSLAQLQDYFEKE